MGVALRVTGFRALSFAGVSRPYRGLGFRIQDLGLRFRA